MKNQRNFIFENLFLENDLTT